MAKKVPDTNSIKSNCLYFDITQQERDAAIRYLLSAILKSRKKCNFPSNYYTFDEDVNVYLAHLLFAISLPEYHEMAEPYLSMDTSDILRWVRSTEDRTIRYFIFKVNADHILMHTAIFDDLIGGKPHRKIFKRSGRHFRELAQLYYDQAAVYHNRIYRKKTGVGDVLEKLSRYFDSYQALLKEVRREYFDFVTSYRDQAFIHFMNEMRNYEGDSKRKEMMDEFLDLYGKWLETKNPELCPKIESVVTEIKKIDPEFQFSFNQDSYGRGFDDERKCA